MTIRAFQNDESVPPSVTASRTGRHNRHQNERNKACYQFSLSKHHPSGREIGATLHGSTRHPDSFRPQLWEEVFTSPLPSE